MKIKTLRFALLTAAFPFAAHAANWLLVHGSEPVPTGAFKLFGFLQPGYTHIDADPIQGLSGTAAAFNGQLIIPNRVGPDLDDNELAQFNRARLGLRGNLVPDRINYFLLIEAGRNAITAQRDVMVTDASVSLHYLPGARIRVGQFKLPTSEEALVPVHTAYPYVFFSNAATNLLVENQVRPIGAVNPAGASNAAVVSGGSGFRDWGVQIYDWFGRGQWEFSYALMGSNGDEIEAPRDDDGNKDLTGRMQASYIFNKSKGPNREDASVWLWHQNGERRFGGQDYNRIREGIGARYQKGPWRTTAEYLRGDGMIVAGPNPPFPGQPTQIGVNEKADGGYVEGGWRFHKEWEIDLRHDVFNRMTGSAALERKFTTTTLGLQYFFYKNTRLTLNYEWRSLEVSNPQAIPVGAQRSNAELIADNLGDRASVQLTWFF